MNADQLIQRARKIKTIEAQSLIQRIENTKRPELRKRLIDKILRALPITANTVPVGHILHRASKLSGGERPDTVSRLSYPPAERIQEFGRCNLPENPVLYTAQHRHTALLEVRPEIGSKFVFSQWRVEQAIPAVPLGYNFEEHVFMHEYPELYRPLLGSYGKGFEYIQNHFNRWFGHLGNEFYEITATLTDCIFARPFHMDGDNTDYSARIAVQYRSRRYAEVTGGNRADNLTISRAAVDAGSVVPIAAQFCEVTQLEGGDIGGTVLSQTSGIDGDSLIWE